jgi:3-(3-hydroxy-phenyl)propionate hydroxylase
MPEPRKRYPFRAPAELTGARGHYPVAIAGAGPIGLAAARDLALKGIRSVILDDDDKVSTGSRAICWAKRTLEIFDRLGCVGPMMQKGVTWNTGKVFYGDDRKPVFSFDLLPDRSQCFPAFINLQQYYVEEYLVELIEQTPLTELRWQSRVSSVRQYGDHVEVGVDTPQGAYVIDADYLIAADGSRSAIRSMLGLEFGGEMFQDHFLIADIRMKAERPSERWFWFDPPFARGQSALLHKQPDDVWRLDFQLGWHVDREAELDEDRVRGRVRRMLGEDARFDLEWKSIYTFQCRRLERFIHDRVIFAGDSAHLVSPFGARGANSGVQDVDNLCWKLACVLQGVSPRSLLDTYDAERVHAARENIRHSTGSTEFITPKSAVSRAFRNAALALARDHPFARAYVNSGRLSLPTRLRESPLTPPDHDTLGGALEPGMPATDSPVRIGDELGWFLRQLGGDFTLVVLGPPSPEAVVPALPVPFKLLHLMPGSTVDAVAGAVIDLKDKIASHAGASPGSCLLFRPDQHLACGFRSLDSRRIRAAVLHCLGRGDSHAGR